MSAYGSYDRMARYSDYSEMEYTPEIASALDIYAEEASASDERGNILHIFSENPKIKSILDDLFYDTLNIDFNITPWVRDLCKYGDLFLFNEVSPEFGIINVTPIPVNEIEREEGFDPNNPGAVRFRWITQGNKVLENWEITHFRLLGNDAFLPYGSSILESARRVWRQLILIEDAMLVYRIVRSPERRVFYIDVGAIPPEEIPNYMEQARTTLRSNSVIDSNTGRVDLRYNPLSVDEDYFIPIRGGEATSKVDTLAGGTNVTAIEDVEYIQKKLFSSLKVPKAFLGYDESIGSKATLSQEDIRFSRTINRIQKIILSELQKIAIIHLHANGFTGEDLLDFDLELSNPSTVAQQQKLELYRTKLEIAGGAPEGVVDRRWVRKEILGLTDDEIDRIEEGRIIDKKSDLYIEGITGEDLAIGGGGSMPPGPGAGPGAPPGEEPSPESPGEEPEGGGESPEPEGEVSPEDLFTGYQLDDDNLLPELDEPMGIKQIGKKSVGNRPITPNAEVSKKNKKRRSDYRNKKSAEYRSTNHVGSDFKRMTGLGRRDDTLRDPYATLQDHHDPFEAFLKASETQLNNRISAKMTRDIESALNTMPKSKIHKNINSLIVESEEDNLLQIDDLIKNISEEKE
jgi:hypothetical protein